jgi:hypothetical protein
MPAAILVFLAQHRHGGCQPRREPRCVDRGLDRLGLVGVQRRELAQPMDQPLAARERAALVCQYPAGDAEQPGDGVAVGVTEPCRGTERGQERFPDHVRDVTGVGAAHDRVAEHPVLVTAVEAP